MPDCSGASADSYDYIVCGGGTSGCVVAGRLAENRDLSILVVEAGDNNDKLENTRMAGGAAMLLGTPADWNIVSEPGSGVKDRTVKLTRGKFLGGSSGINGTLCIRGSKQDYDDWGIEGWSGDEVFRYMSKAETFHGKPWFNADVQSHGYSGPIHTEPHDLAPISSLVMKSYQSFGLPYEPDMFSTGQIPHGCGDAPRSVWQGIRSTGADYITRDQSRQNVTIKTNTYVDKVVLEQQNGVLRATGVELVSVNGTRSIALARREVIISAGAYCSPTILLRSGIGSKEEISPFGIASQVDLPGVGKNLMDHLIAGLFYEVSKPGLTSDHLVHHSGALAKSLELWKTQKSGFFSTFPFGAFAYARLDDRLETSPLWNNAKRLSGRDPMDLTTKQPHIELFSTECFLPGFAGDEIPGDSQFTFSVLVELFSPRSKGTVTLKSADPLENPVITPHYLEDPLDVLVLAEGARFANEVVMRGAGTKDVVKGSWPATQMHHAYTKTEEWEGFVREGASTCYHPGGTCKMGNDNDDLAVVDKELRVRGVSNLRVVDVSIMPKLHGGHTQMPAYGIGEKGADLIKASARNEREFSKHKPVLSGIEVHSKIYELMDVLLSYERLASRRLDLVGDYAGKELFIVEGDSLLRECFSDLKIDFDPGFQLLHAAYVVERLINGLVQRKCNFHIVFFGSNSRLSYPEHGDEAKYGLARAAIIRHLSTHLKAPLTIEVRVFKSVLDPHFTAYLERSGAYFVVCHDGAERLQHSERQADGGVSRTTWSDDEKIFKERLRAMILWFIGKGYNVALINGMEMKDSKIFATVEEGSPRYIDMEDLTNLISVSNESQTLMISTEDEEIVADAIDWHRTRVKDLQSIMQSLSNHDPEDTDSNSEKVYLTLLVLSRMISEKSATADFAFSFLVHMILLDHFLISNRRFMPNNLDERYENGVVEFLKNFAKAATILLSSPEWVDEIESASCTCDVIDLVDGRLFCQVFSALRNGLPKNLLPLPLSLRLDRLWDALSSLCGPLDKTQSSPEHQPNRSNPLKSEHKSLSASKTSSLLPFSHPIFDKHLSPVQITIGSSAVPSNKGRQNRLFLELSHWHNVKRLLDPKKKDPVLPANLEMKRKTRALRRDQWFMAEMTAYAASLTNASGKMLEPTIVTVGETKKKGGETNYSKPKAKVVPSNKKKGTKAGDASTSTDVRAINAEKDRAKVISAWQSKRDMLDNEVDLEKRYKDTQVYMDLLPSSKRNHLEADINLYLLRTLLQIWDAHSRKDPKFDSSGLAALIWDTIQRLTNLEGGLPKAHAETILGISKALGFPFDMASISAESKPLPLQFNSKSLTKALGIHKSAAEFQLHECGPYLIRSVGATKDDRVPFDPDEWQRKVLDELDANHSVFVVAPTSAGKTFISFYAMEQVLRADDDGILVYVAPTKALVNQIAAEVQARFSKKFKYPGRSVWAIHTRDLRINNATGCQILVTVPHILQIMLLAPINANSWSTRVKRIIFDEVHCIGQADDGLIWEQLLLLAPCPIIALSATVGNPQAFNSWLADSQGSLGYQLTMIKYDQRYSDLRKFLYMPPKSYSFKGLPERAGFARLGLDGIPDFSFLHPVLSLVNRSRGIPEDLTLEPRDCLTLWKAMRQSQTDQFPIKEELDPYTALPSVPHKADVLRWEVSLKILLRAWMADPNSPFDKVLCELGKPMSKSTPQSVQTSRSVDDLHEDEGERLDPDNIYATTLPLLCRLQEHDCLPAIVFNYNRTSCEKLCQQILTQLETTETSWKDSSQAWKTKIAAWEKWKTAKEKEKSSRPSKPSSKKQTKDKDDEEGPNKADSVRDAANMESSPWTRFSPDAPLDNFNFANKKKLSEEELRGYIDVLQRRHVTPYLITALARGIGVHHAGMNKKYRHAVEILFRRGYLRVVFATGTLALGINMPCKTVIFSGDSVFLTALNFRQAAGRAGRRGFDLLGNVIFQGIPNDKIYRLLSSRLPDLNGHFPITTSLVLRLFMLLHESKDSAYAQKAINSLLAQPRLYLGGDAFKNQVLHHLRFSIEYLRRQHLLDAVGTPLNFAGSVSHLYYTENSSFAFHALLKEGFFHDLCAELNHQRIELSRQLMIVMAHLFGRRPLPQYNMESLNKKIKKFSSVIILPPMPAKATQILREHNKDTLDVFSAYVRTYVDQHIKADDCKLPLTRLHVGGKATDKIARLQFCEPARYRSAFVALSGHDDTFETISDMCSTVREGVFLEEAVIPHLDVYPDEAASPLNAYLYDFYTHGDVTTLSKANGIHASESWFVLNDFSMVMATLTTSIANYMKLSPTSDVDMLDIQGDGDALENERDDLLAGSDDGDSVATGQGPPSLVSGTTISTAASSMSLPTRNGTKKPKVVDSWDEEGSDGGSGQNSEGGGDGVASDDDLETNVKDEGLPLVLKAFQRLRAEFDAKFKEMWA